MASKQVNITPHLTTNSLSYYGNSPPPELRIENPAALLCHDLGTGRAPYYSTVNHVLITLPHRPLEHSEKTIDVVCGSRIVNFSIGTQRTDAQGESATGSGQDSNAEHSHSGNGGSTSGDAADAGHPTPAQLALCPGPRDQRPENTEDPAGGERRPRIDQTFRHIDTFVTSLSRSPSPLSSAGRLQEQQKQQLIFGQGATAKIGAEAAHGTWWRGGRASTRGVRRGEPRKSE